MVPHSSLLPRPFDWTGERTAQGSATGSLPNSDPWSRRELAIVLLIVAVSLALRLAVVWKTEMINRDGPYYAGLALMINTGQWLQTVGDWFLFNPYPLLIAMVARTGIDYETAGQLVCGVSAALAVVPLYFWCRSAFDRRVAAIAAGLYAIHPILLRLSGQVFREGLYWLLMLSAVALLWEAVQRASWWRFFAGGLLATAATLTRIEGAAVFLLAGLWWLGTRNQVDRVRWRRGAVGSAVAVATFPLVLMVLNFTFIPADQGWRGGNRLLQLGSSLLAIAADNEEHHEAGAATRNSPPENETAGENSSPAEATAGNPPPANVRDLANSLPVFHVNGVPDLEQQRLRRLLILCDDHREVVFVAKFVRQCLEGFQIPLVGFLIVGLVWGGRRWKRSRDLPLAIQSALLVGMFFFYLTTVHVLECRYLFCLMPLVFPWAAVGMLETYERSRDWFAARGESRRQRILVLAAITLLVGAAVGKAFSGLDSEKVHQRWLGEHLRQGATHRLAIAGPESLRRIGFYANGDFLILPKAPVADVQAWLDGQRIDFVVLAEGEHPTYGPAEIEQENSGRYRRVYAEEPRFGDLHVYRVEPPREE